MPPRGPEAAAVRDPVAVHVGPAAPGLLRPAHRAAPGEPRHHHVSAQRGSLGSTGPLGTSQCLAHVADAWARATLKCAK